MSNVISKVRCYNPSYSDTQQGNKNHLYYIARRNMALVNEKGVSTFGEIEGLDVENTSLKEIAKEIGKKSENKTNIYRGIISLKENEALELGFDNQEEWKELMQRRIYDIGKELGIPPLNCQWVAVVHLKKGNPHLHYMVWDKSQKINSYFITTKQQCRIRELITKDIFDDELKQYYKIQDGIKGTLKDKAISLEVKAFDNKNCIGKLAYINLSSKVIKELINKFKDIKSHIPKDGRLSYALMPNDVKKKINEFTKIFIENNTDLKNEYDKYIETARKIGSMYGDGSKKYYEQKAKKELDKILGNQLLNSIKILKNEQLQEKLLVRDILQEMFRFLSILNESNEAKLNLYSNYKGEMSKQAKKDFAKNKANASSINWEQ